MVFENMYFNFGDSFLFVLSKIDTYTMKSVKEGCPRKE